MQVRSSGTQVAVITTEHTLYNETTDNLTLVLTVDANAMANGDVLELRVKEKTLVGSTTRVVWTGVVSNVQGDPILKSPPLDCAYDATFTLKQTDGTGRSFDWRVVSL